MADLPHLILSSSSDRTMQLKAGQVAQDNRQRFCKKISIDYSRVVAAQLANGNNISIVGDKETGSVQIATDGLITTNPNVYLSITVADCLPVVLYAKNRVISLLHCGWRGLDSKIVEKAVKMIGVMGILPREISAMIGPGIESHHYPVGKEVADKFIHYPGAVTKNNLGWLLDLKTISLQQLQSGGIKEITISPICTYCDPTCFSARRNKTLPVKAMMALVSL